MRNVPDSLAEIVGCDLALFDGVTQRFVDDGQKTHSAPPVDYPLPLAITGGLECLGGIDVGLMSDDEDVALIELLLCGTVIRVVGHSDLAASKGIDCSYHFIRLRD